MLTIPKQYYFPSVCSRLTDIRTLQKVFNEILNGNAFCCALKGGGHGHFHNAFFGTNP